MNLNLQFVKRNSQKVYDVLAYYTRCTFDQLEKLCNLTSTELEKLCNLTSTELCLALAQLIREHKIEQYSERRAVYYRLPA